MWEKISSRIPDVLKRKETLVALGVAGVIVAAAVFPDQIRAWLGVENEIPGRTAKYRGRPVGEYREVPAEVKLFSQDQRDILRQRLADAAGSTDVNPDMLDPWLQAGLIKKMIGDYEGARDTWEYASLIRPANSISFKNLGELYWHYLPDFPKAEKNFQIAIANEAELFDAYISLSDLYRYSYTEKSDLADDVLLDGLSKNPKQERDFVSYIARYYKETGSTGKAIEYYERLFRLEPNNPDIAKELRALKSR